jgi:hypothetical protein
LTNGQPANSTCDHLFHPASIDLATDTPLGPFTCGYCGKVELFAPPGVTLSPTPLAPPPPLPSTITPKGELPEELAEIPEHTRARALQLYREHGARAAASLTGLHRDTVRELAIYEINSYRASRRQLRREYLKELLQSQATNLLEELQEYTDAKDKQSLAAAAGILIDKLRLESGDPSVIQETRELEDPIARLSKEL